MASRIAVPPRESMRVSASHVLDLGDKVLAGRVVDISVVVEIHDEVFVTGLESVTSARAAASTLARFGRMLPLLSIINPTETGVSSRLNRRMPA